MTTRILHTSDLHLSSGDDERLAGLDHLLEVAERREVDLLTISGDLFDSTEDAERLRPRLRDRFSDRDYRVLAISGNHDPDAFQGDLHFGSDFRPLVERPYEAFRAGEVRVVGVPYTPRFTDELRLALSQRPPHDGPEVLLLHASLEAPFEDRYAGEEEETRYCPVTGSGVAALGFDWVLAGHYHNVHEVRLDGGGFFLYPGTPTSVARDERGVRSAYLVDTGRERPEAVELETFHYDRLERTVRPGGESDLLEEIRAWAAERSGRRVEAEVVVRGHTERPEGAFHRELEEAAAPLSLEDRVRSVERVVEHPLYRMFAEALAERDAGNRLREDAERRLLRVFSTLMARGELK